MTDSRSVTLANPEAAAAIDPANIAARGQDLGERLFVGAATGVFEPTTLEIIGVGREMVRSTISTIARATGIQDPAFHRYWGDILAEAIVSTFNVLSCRSADSGETLH